MLTVIGTWELGWNTPIKEVELWGYPLKEYDVDEWFMSPVSGIASGFPFLHEDTQMEPRIALERALGRTIVFVDESATSVGLDDFVHPADACYVMGKTGLSPYVAFFRPDLGDRCVVIHTHANLGGFWAHQAIAIVLADRKRKE